MSSFEVLFVEDNIYYIRHYTDRESRGVNLKLSKDEFMRFKEHRIEV